MEWPLINLLKCSPMSSNQRVHYMCPFLDPLTLNHTPINYSLRFKLKVTFGHKLRYKIKVTFGDFSLKLCQTNWNVARNNVIVVVDELPSQIEIYTCLTIDNWTQWHRHTST